jgi:hypothetical protein
MTPFYSTLVLPLEALDWSVAAGNNWVAGPAYADVAPHLDTAGRCNFYANPEPVRALLLPEVRRHVMVDVTVDHLRVRAVELVGRTVEWTSIVGYLVVHLESAPEAPEISALSQIGEVARPGTKPARAMHDLLERELGVLPWRLKSQLRAASLSLSGIPKADERGLVRWTGSRPEDRRIVDLVTLPKHSRDIGSPFALEEFRPTPSYSLAGSRSGPSLGVIRNRPLDESHAMKMRTLWLDAFMVELVQRDALIGVIERLQALVSNPRKSWRALRESFRVWRTTWSWQASTDHAIEAGISDLLRRELGTDRLVARAEAELADHAGDESLRSEAAVGVAVLLLTVATVLTPLLLHASTATSDAIDGWFLAALVVSSAILGGVAWQMRSARRR